MMPTPTHKDARLDLGLHWLQARLGNRSHTTRAVSGDASFRRYFRITTDDTSYILMDAPPPRENVQTFIQVADLLRQTGVQVPDILHADIQNGFLLLSDLGSVCYLDRLETHNTTAAEPLYQAAMDSLMRLQLGVDIRSCHLPLYEQALLEQEMGLFQEWFLKQLLSIDLTPSQSTRIKHTQSLLSQSALAQPRCCVHRDFHSRNLMFTEQNNPGVLDFQDAVIGPVTYDLVSLLRDCYIRWPEPWVGNWIETYRERLRSTQQIPDVDASTFRRWVDWMGLQRHLKAIGIFARLKLRDHKPGYLADIPRTLTYVRRVAEQYPELSAFKILLDEVVEPRMRDNAAFSQ